jgi:ABC-type multidrug transport system ATPase subunit
MTEPKALLVDEPMMGLDPTSIQETLNILASLKEKGTSILLSTHIIDMIDDIWDSAYILKDGKVVAETKKPTQEEPLKELFFRVTQSHVVGQGGDLETDEIIN